MTGGFLYITIVVMWAVVLIPLWWRGRAQSHPMRSIDRFNGVMRTLSGEAGELTRRQVRLTPVQRRRRVLSVLTGLLVLLTVAAATGAVSWAWVLLPVGLIAAFVRLARGQVLRERAQRAAGRRADGEGMHEAQPERSPQSAPLGSSAWTTAPASPVAATAHVQVAGDVTTPSAARGVRFDDRTWSAAPPAPLPMYIDAPAATSIPRVIDLKTPGAWSAQAMLREVEEMRAGTPEPAGLTPGSGAPAALAGLMEDLAHDSEQVDMRDERLERLLRRAVND